MTKSSFDLTKALNEPVPPPNGTRRYWCQDCHEPYLAKRRRKPCLCDTCKAKLKQAPEKPTTDNDFHIFLTEAAQPRRRGWPKTRKRPALYYKAATCIVGDKLHNCCKHVHFTERGAWRCAQGYNKFVAPKTEKSKRMVFARDAETLRPLDETELKRAQRPYERCYDDPYDHW